MPRFARNDNLKMKNDQKPIIITILLTLVLLFGGIFLLSKGGNNNTNSTKVDQNLLLGKNSYQTSPKNAKVTLVEFGDYECPACGYTSPIVKQVLEQYKSKINYVFRHFPLPQHKNALSAAEAAEAAGSQGKFFQMHDALYSNQSEWASSDNPLTFFLKYARLLKLDTKKFEQDVKNNKFQAKIDAGLSDGSALGINATPTFYINNIKLEDAPTFQNFKSKIDSLLQ